MFKKDDVVKFIKNKPHNLKELKFDPPRIIVDQKTKDGLIFVVYPTKYTNEYNIKLEQRLMGDPEDFDISLCVGSFLESDLEKVEKDK